MEPRTKSAASRVGVTLKRPTARIPATGRRRHCKPLQTCIFASPTALRTDDIASKCQQIDAIHRSMALSGKRWGRPPPRLAPSAPVRPLAHPPRVGASLASPPAGPPSTPVAFAHAPRGFCRGPVAPWCRSGPGRCDRGPRPGPPARRGVGWCRGRGKMAIAVAAGKARTHHCPQNTAGSEKVGPVEFSGDARRTGCMRSSTTG
jgi:hypothetical protein